MVVSVSAAGSCVLNTCCIRLVPLYNETIHSSSDERREEHQPKMLMSESKHSIDVSPIDLIYDRILMHSVGISNVVSSHSLKRTIQAMGDTTGIATLWTYAYTVSNKMKSAKGNWNFLSSFNIFFFLASPSYPSLQRHPPPPTPISPE